MKLHLCAGFFAILIGFASSCALLQSRPASPYAHLSETEQQNEALALMGLAERQKTAGNIDEAIFTYERVAREFPDLKDEATGTPFETLAKERLVILKCLKRRGKDAFHASKLGLIVQMRDSFKNQARDVLLTLVSCDFSMNKRSTELDVLQKIDPIIAMSFIVNQTEQFIWEREKLIDHDQLFYPGKDGSEHRFLFSRDPEKGWLWIGYTSTSIEKYQP